MLAVWSTLPTILQTTFPFHNKLREGPSTACSPEKKMHWHPKLFPERKKNSCKEHAPKNTIPIKFEQKIHATLESSVPPNNFLIGPSLKEAFSLTG